MVVPPMITGYRIKLLLELGKLEIKSKLVGLSETEKQRLQAIMKQLTRPWPPTMP